MIHIPWIYESLSVHAINKGMYGCGLHQFLPHLLQLHNTSSSDLSATFVCCSNQETTSVIIAIDLCDRGLTSHPTDQKNMCPSHNISADVSPLLKGASKRCDNLKRNTNGFECYQSKIQWYLKLIEGGLNSFHFHQDLNNMMKWNPGIERCTNK